MKPKKDFCENSAFFDLMGVLNLGMSIMGIDQNIQKVVKGMVLLAAVIFDVVSKRKSFIVK